MTHVKTGKHQQGTPDANDEVSEGKGQLIEHITKLLFIES